MKASERKALVALLEMIANALGRAEADAEALARDDIDRRKAVDPKAYENATHYPYQVGALGAKCRGGAESIRSAIRCYLAPKVKP